jgi:hypothetical protein
VRLHVGQPAFYQATRLQGWKMAGFDVCVCGGGGVAYLNVAEREMGGGGAGP